MKLPLFAVPERECEHAGATVQCTVETPAVNRGQQHLGIGVAAEFGRLCSALELRPERAMVVNLSVERDHIATGG